MQSGPSKFRHFSTGLNLSLSGGQPGSKDHLPVTEVPQHGTLQRKTVSESSRQEMSQFKKLPKEGEVLMPLSRGRNRNSRAVRAFEHAPFAGLFLRCWRCRACVFRATGRSGSWGLNFGSRCGNIVSSGGLEYTVKFSEGS